MMPSDMFPERNVLLAELNQLSDSVSDNRQRVELTNKLVQFPLGNWSKNIELAITAYTRAINIWAQNDMHIERAETLMHLANAYLKRIKGDKAENIEKAINACKQALEVHTQDTMLVKWAETMMYMGNAYVLRIKGDKTKNIETAIYTHEKALSQVPKGDNEELWATLQNESGNALKRYYQKNWGENIEAAINKFEQALTVRTQSAMSIEWAQTMMNLGNAYRNRIKGDKAENIEQAIKCHTQALSVQTQLIVPVDWAHTMNSLGNAYRDRLMGNRAENIELAIDAYEQALMVRTRSERPAEWGQTLNNLGNAYAERIKGDKAENIELAIDAYKQALTVRTMPIEKAITMMNLGNAYIERIKESKAQNIEEALDTLHKASIIMKDNAMFPDWAIIMNNLGNANLQRIEGVKAQNIEKAIAAYNNALRVRITMPWAMAETMMNLGNAYLERIEEDKAENIEKAIAIYNQVLKIWTKNAMPGSWAEVMMNLGNAYRNRINGNREDNIRLAINAYQDSLTVRTPEASPGSYRQTQRNLGNLYFTEERWSDAAVSYTKAIDVGNDLLATAITDPGRRAETSETTVLYANAAYCQLRMNHYNEALVQLEAGKTRLLNETLALTNVSLEKLLQEQRNAYRTASEIVRELEVEYRLPPGANARRDDRTLVGLMETERRKLRELIKKIRETNPNFIPEGLGLSDLLELIPEGGALVAPLITSQGSAIFAIPHGVNTVSEEHIIQMDDFTVKGLIQLLIGTEKDPGWLRAYIDFRDDIITQRAWKIFLDEYTGKLWDVLVEKIYIKLIALGIQQDSEIILIPQGGLGLLPLHAAWRLVDDEAYSLLDDYVIRYVPSAYILAYSQQHLSKSHGDHTALVAAVGDPTVVKYRQVEPLPYARAGAKAVATLFNVEPLIDEGATKNHILQQATGKGYVHLSCHGVFNLLNPLESQLILAGDEPLTLAEIMSELSLNETRLVTLSACETGITDIRQSPDEYLGFPAAFMQATVPGVVSSLWTVSDHTTARLMEQFYKFHLEDDLEPATALRQAQLWLRDNSSDDNPFYWAAFTFTGV